MQIVEIASDVVPEPGSSTVQYDTVLLAVVVVWLVLAPARFLYDFACKHTIVISIIDGITKERRIIDQAASAVAIALLPQ